MHSQILTITLSRPSFPLFNKKNIDYLFINKIVVHKTSSHEREREREGRFPKTIDNYNYYYVLSALAISLHYTTVNFHCVTRTLCIYTSIWSILTACKIIISPLESLDCNAILSLKKERKTRLHKTMEKIVWQCSRDGLWPLSLYLPLTNFN